MKITEHLDQGTLYISGELFPTELLCCIFEKRFLAYISESLENPDARSDGL